MFEKKNAHPQTVSSNLQAYLRLHNLCCSTHKEHVDRPVEEFSSALYTLSWSDIQALLKTTCPIQVIAKSLLVTARDGSCLLVSIFYKDSEKRCTLVECADPLQALSSTPSSMPFFSSSLGPSASSFGRSNSSLGPSASSLGPSSSTLPPSPNACYRAVHRFLELHGFQCCS